MSDQQEKYQLSLAGEFFVAAELLRQGALASITYGNAKRADVVAFSKDRKRAMIVEVKTTHSKKWVLGHALPPADKASAWVFVNIPKDSRKHPNFYILMQDEVFKLCKMRASKYDLEFKEKHGEVYGDRRRIRSIRYEDVEMHCGKWEKITAQL